MFVLMNFLINEANSKLALGESEYALCMFVFMILLKINEIISSLKY